MAVRHAVAEEVVEILPLVRAYCDFYEASPTDAGIEEMVRGVIDLPDEQAFLLVAEDGDEIVGFAACAWKWSSLRGARIVYLDDLFVRPESRGEGHADSLIAACADLARDRGAPVLSWLTAPDNDRARAVYDRVGGTAETFLEYELEL